MLQLKKIMAHQTLRAMATCRKGNTEWLEDEKYFQAVQIYHSQTLHDLREDTNGEYYLKYKVQGYKYNCYSKVLPPNL